MAGGRARLDDGDRVGALPPDCAVEAAGSGSSPRTYEATTRSACPRACPRSPSTQRASGSSSRPAARISGSISTRVSSVRDGQLERRPGGDARPGADVEQRSRTPIGSLHDDLPEHRRRSGERRRRAIREIGRHLRLRPRRPRLAGAAIRRREQLDLLRDRPARAGDEPLDPLRQLRRQRAQEARAARTSSACVSGFTFRISLATLPSASITKVERSTPMYVLPRTSSPSRRRIPRPSRGRCRRAA